MVKEQRELHEMRDFLQQVYDLGEKDTQQVNVAELSDDDVRTLVGNLRKGLPVATPVFDGAKSVKSRPC